MSLGSMCRFSRYDLGMTRQTQLGPNIRRARKHRGLSQEELAKELAEATPGEDERAQSHISAIERGVKLPSVPLLIAMADFFETSVDDLLGRNEYDSEPAPVLFVTEEAEEAAKIVDDMTPEYRQNALAVVRAISDRDKKMSSQMRRVHMIVERIVDQQGVDSALAAIEELALRDSRTSTSAI